MAASPMRPQIVANRQSRGWSGEQRYEGTRTCFRTGAGGDRWCRRHLGHRQHVGPLRGQVARLAPVEDGFRNVRSEIAEADQPREIRRAHTFPLGDCGKRQAIGVNDFGVEPVRPDQQLDQPRVACTPVSRGPDTPPRKRASQAIPAARRAKSPAGPPRRLRAAT